MAVGVTRCCAMQSSPRAIGACLFIHRIVRLQSSWSSQLASAEQAGSPPTTSQLSIATPPAPAHMSVTAGSFTSFFGVLSTKAATPAAAPAVAPPSTMVAVAGRKATAAAPPTARPTYVGARVQAGRWQAAGFSRGVVRIGQLFCQHGQTAGSGVIAWCSRCSIRPADKLHSMQTHQGLTLANRLARSARLL